MLKELVDSGLFGKNLVLIDSPILVERYNACLIDMGLQPTKRKKFHIDRLGWSPEVAQSFGNRNYLSHGNANPLSIVLTPDQAHASIHYAFHSFDWELMAQWYPRNLRAITILTEFTGIWLDLDQDVAAYRDEMDLIMVDGVTVRAHTPGDLMKKATGQQRLVQQFLHEKDLAKLCTIGQEIVTSAVEIGDFRSSAVDIPDFEYTGVCTYFTRAFGGTFVLCGANGSAKKRYILNKYTAQNSGGIHSVIDQNILHQLYDMELISDDLAWWQPHLHILEIIRDSFLIDELEKMYHDYDLMSANPAQRKKKIQEMIDQIASEYALLDQLIHNISKGNYDVVIDPLVRSYLMHPAVALNGSASEIILHILTLVCDRRNVLFFSLL